MSDNWMDDLRFDGAESDPGDVVDEDVARVARRALLVEQAKLPGVRGQLAAELLVAHDERQRSVEASVLAKLGNDAAADPEVDWTDPDTLDLVRASERAKEARAAVLSERLQRQALVAEGREESDVESEMAQQKLRAAAVAAFEPHADPLLSSEAYQGWLEERRAADAAARLAADELSLQSEAEALAEAREGIEATYLALTEAV
jgi:hypothetical protein